MAVGNLSVALVAEQQRPSACVYSSSSGALELNNVQGKHSCGTVDGQQYDCICKAQSTHSKH